MKSTSKTFIQSLVFTIVIASLIYGHQLFKKPQHIPTRIVGSSVAFPFISYIAETISEKNKHNNAVIEITGTGAGFKLFCQKHHINSQPDIVAASRRITAQEIELCNQNNIKPSEILFGYDAMLLLSSGQSITNLTRDELFLAMAEFIPSGNKLVKNNLRYWQDINHSLPKTPIEIYGPPHSSGTRDEINHIIMTHACKHNKLFSQYKKRNVCTAIRRDGKYIETGDNENLTIQKLKMTPNALGILGYNFYIGNQDLTPIKIDSIYPDLSNITSFKYPLTRPLYLYFNQKNQKTLKDFMLELTKNDFFAQNSKLIKIGLIPINADRAKELHNLILNSFK